MSKHSGHLSRVFEERKYFIEFLMIVVGLGIGLEILASGIIEIFGITPIQSILIGIGITLIGIVFIARRLLSHRILKKEIKGVIFYRNKDMEILNTYPYDFCSSIHYYFDSLFNENEAILRLWERENLNFPNNDFREMKFDHYGYSLFIKAVQYYLIQKISTHLVDYFWTHKVNEKKLVKLYRENISEILVKNEFLELFSKPINLRPQFEEEDFNEDLVSHYWEGLMYEKFELSLPKGSKIIIEDKGKLIVKTPRFELEFTVAFGGSGFGSHSEIKKHYFGFKKTSKIVSYDIIINISVRFNRIFLFTRSGWLYYNWIDSLIDWLEKEISFDSFYEEINWKTISTLLHIEEMNKERSK